MENDLQALRSPELTLPAPSIYTDREFAKHAEYYLLMHGTLPATWQQALLERFDRLIK